MRTPSANETLDSVRALLQIESDAELARRLGVSRATVATWRSRNRIPEAPLMKLQRMREEEWISHLPAERENYAGEVAGAVMLRIRDVAQEATGVPSQAADETTWASWMHVHETDFAREIIKGIPENISHRRFHGLLRTCVTDEVAMQFRESVWRSDDPRPLFRGLVEGAQRGAEVLLRDVEGQ